MQPFKALDRIQKPSQKGCMPNEPVKFSVWTEGLGEIWGITQDNQERRQRDAMSVSEIHSIVDKLINDFGDDTNGLFIIEYKGKVLNLELVKGALEMSDPSDLNYQNISISLEEAEQSILDYFGIKKEEVVVRNSHVILIEWIIAITVGCAMVASIVYVKDFLETRDHFIPEPDHAEIKSQADFRSHLSRLSGVFMTNLDAGETVIEIHADGRWGFYDLEKASLRKFTCLPVESGLCRPVYSEGQLSLLTDAFFLFKVGDTDTLVFQDRKYIRAGKSRDDLPFVAFPE